MEVRTGTTTSGPASAQTWARRRRSAQWASGCTPVPARSTATRGCWGIGHQALEGTPYHSAAVGAGEHFHVVAGWIFEVETAAVCIDLILPLVSRVGPVRQAAFCEPLEDCVKLLLADQEGVVVVFGTRSVVVIEADAVVRLDTDERPERLRRIETEDLTQREGRGLLDLCRDDRVVQLYSHGGSLRRDASPVLTTWSHGASAVGTSGSTVGPSSPNSSLP